MIFTHIPMEAMPELVDETLASGRTYQTPDGNRYPSITTVLKILSDEGIKAWRDRVGKEESSKVLHQASVRGTKVHELAERYINNDPKWDRGAMPINLFTFNGLRSILDSRVNNIMAQEVPLYSDKLKIAGRVDLIAEFDGELTIIDFKTARKAKKEDWVIGYRLQASFYAAAFYERTGIPIRKYAVLISPDGAEPQVFAGNTYENIKQLCDVRREYYNQYGI